jgi:hypothetical protein
MFENGGGSLLMATLAAICLAIATLASSTVVQTDSTYTRLESRLNINYHHYYHRDYNQFRHYNYNHDPFQL